MPAIVVVGAQWGDEGKGKIVDLLSEKAKWVVRYSGGNNAGHTVINSYGEFKLRLIPSGICYSHTTCILGNGMVISPTVLFEEMDDLTGRGIKIDGKLFISDRAHMIMPYHLLLEGLDEEARGGAAIGTTRRGIGPAFTDKAARIGIRAGDLLDKKVLREKLNLAIAAKNAIITRVYNQPPVNPEEIYEQYLRYGERLAPFIRDMVPVLADAVARDESILLEGAQGTLLDPDFGTYPYVTSSSPLAGNSSLGAGVSPLSIRQIIGVFKAYVSRVGAGPFPTVIKDKLGEMLRERAHEYGTTTGRARDCGWFDAVAARYSTRLNGFTGVAVTRLDVLDILPSLKICTGYKLDGKVIDSFPSNTDSLSRCQPVYEELPGWQTSTENVRSYELLPVNAKKYLARIEELSGCHIQLVSVGAAREQTIIREPVW